MLVQFVADTLFKTLIAVPIVGGLVLVALVVGGNPFDLLRLDDLTRTVTTMFGVLMAQPVALAAFAVALAVIMAGGSILMFAVKAGTLTVLLAGDRAAGAIEVPPLRLAMLRDANQATLELFVGGVRRLFSRYLRLGIMLTISYGVIAAGYFGVAFGPSLSPALDALALTLASFAVLIVVTLVNFLYLLTQIAMAAEDCTVLEAVPHVGRLIRRRTKDLGFALAAILALMLMATGASILATTALGLIAFVPFVGLAALPLQVFAWLVRGVVFQYVGLTGVATYFRLHFAAQSAGVEVHTPSDGLSQATRA